MRIKIEVPSGYGYTLGDCLLAGNRIDWAGQIFDASVTVFLLGVAVPGTTFLCANPEEKAIVTCKHKWKYTAEETVGPIPRLNPLYPAPKHPVLGVDDNKRNSDLDSSPLV